MAPASGAAGAERNLLGAADLPPPPATASLQPAPATLGLGDGARIAFYNADYHGYPVRVAYLQRPLADARGQPYALHVQAAESTDRRSATRAGLLQRELWQDLRMLLATLLVVWLGIAWTLRPLQRLRRSLAEAAPGELRPLAAHSVPREVAPLVEALNQHIAEHRAVLDEQGRLLADASHQLRTPLAIMMTQAGYALRESDPAILRETLQAIMAQLARSRRLSDQLLAMAHAGRTEAEPEAAPLVDLNAIAREVVLQHLPLAREKKQDLGWVDARGADTPEAAASQPATLPVRASAAELHEALANLLHNAIRHTPAGGSITLATRAEAGHALATVCDEGPGIAPAQREQVFQRFRREGGNEGAGLGLAIARAYARRNGGEITLADGAGGRGLCAALVLPLAGL
jgi:two-component system sensor histidine kinase TctE